MKVLMSSKIAMLLNERLSMYSLESCSVGSNYSTPKKRLEKKKSNSRPPWSHYYLNVTQKVKNDNEDGVEFVVSVE